MNNLAPMRHCPEVNDRSNWMLGYTLKQDFGEMVFVPVSPDQSLVCLHENNIHKVPSCIYPLSTKRAA